MIPMIDLIPPSALADIKSDARQRAPSEACGVVLDDGSYRQLPNIAPDPTTRFVVPDADWAAVFARVRVVVHSHVGGPFHPTKTDMEQCVAGGLPWAIVVVGDFGDVSDAIVWGTRERAPLLGRTFIHGVFDCYSLIRDWWLIERGVDLPEFPRDDAWWDDGEDLYGRGFASAGFHAIDRRDVSVGDVMLTRWGRHPVLSHGGVILDGGQLWMHHLPGRLSRREPLAPWVKPHCVFLRHESLS